MKKKSNAGLIVFTVILFIAVLGLAGYIAYDKFVVTSVESTDKKETNTEEKVKVENLEVVDPIVISALNKLTDRFNCNSFNYVYLKDTKVTASDLPNDVVYNLALSNFYDEIFEFNGNGNIHNDFTAVRLREEIDKIVGKDYKFTDVTYISTCPAWTYNESTKVYEAPKTSACGCAIGPVSNKAKVTKAYKEGNKLIINLRALFTNGEKYYKDRAFTKEITGLETYKQFDFNVLVESDKNYSLGGLYVLEFEEVDGNYIFNYSKPIDE